MHGRTNISSLYAVYGHRTEYYSTIISYWKLETTSGKNTALQTSGQEKNEDSYFFPTVNIQIQAPIFLNDVKSSQILYKISRQ